MEEACKRRAAAFRREKAVARAAGLGWEEGLDSVADLDSPWPCSSTTGSQSLRAVLFAVLDMSIML